MSIDVTCTAGDQPNWFTNRIWTEHRVGADWVVGGSEFWITDPALESTGTARGACSGRIGASEISAGALLAGTEVAGHSTIEWR
jgi:hypothetical protein